MEKRFAMDELIIGSHVSFTKIEQLLGSVKEAISYGANTFMFYTGAPQNTNRYPIDDTLTQKAYLLMKENDIDLNNVIVHAPYIINLANSEKNYDFAINFLKEEIKRVEKLGVSKLVLHPGSHVGLGVDEGLDNIVFALNKVLSVDTNVTICLETMAGKGTELGCTFEQIKKILDSVILKDKIMVCMDTCHINDAGYDLTDIDKIIDDFERIIGLEKLGCIHINDSKNELGSHKDRHDNIGFGTIGFDKIMKVINHPKLKKIPKILETPYVIFNNDKKLSYPPYKFEIEMIRKNKMNHNLKEDIFDYYK